VKSIKNRLFLQVGIIVVLMIVLIMTSYALLFEVLYKNVAKTKLFNEYEYINELERSDYSTIKKELDKRTRGLYMDVFIHSSEGELLYQSKEYLIDSDKLKMLDILPSYLDDTPSFLEIYDEERINTSVSFFWAHDYLIDTETLNIIGNLDNGDHVILRVRLIPSEISVVASNRFVPIVGILVFIIGIVFAYILSITFTRPLIAMNKATTEISNLKFDIVCPVDSKDEIGQLAEKINILSQKLKMTIEDLNIRNNELNNEIAEKTKIDENRRQLLNNVSHELKTPLTLMQSYADGLRLNVAQNHNKVEYYCDVIVDETENMNSLINQLLDINRISSGDITPVHAEIEIVAFIRNLLNRYNDIVMNQNIHLEFNEIEPTLSYVDPKNLETVLSNLLENAIKYVDNNKKISISLIDIGSNIRVEVYNSTNSIPKDSLEKIWDSFYKVDESRNRNVRGHGLGLSIIKAIQESDQMKYGVYNIEDGVIFWIDVRKVC